MEVPVSALRAELKSWIERAREGEEVVITERGVPVARLTGVATADLVTELVRDGVLVPPAGERPVHAVPADAGTRTEGADGVRPSDGARGGRGGGVAALVRRIRR
ncbi:prevent-host-death family protein [Cellulosimicrobium cellulans]|jgi:prevent-host-death family protein|uniref:Antitoxin n=1 Tax=Cellulosimicrobium cellulans TaxID=1710 RepID=A0A1Y0HUN0_CELCE|nr:type II toxin-antitoxin system prevent-host-death family antitoxin [Cellulosimicrobium cellulans]ARU50853.1 prevent-host-death protein [Cellulosimicrobium cellulans]MBM7821267.1 prevent-host-death family protein [Cellulosimicrobium cellulans]